MIEAILKGDPKAFKWLVDTYQLMVVNICHAFVHDREDAEDIAQDVFIQVYESLNKFRFESKLSTWLYRIAVNRSINHCQFLSKKVLRIDIESWKEKAQFPGMPQHELLEVQEQIELLQKAIDKLPENQRTALILNKYEELSYKEIAEVMGQSLSSVESLLFRAKTNLEKILNTK